MATENITEFSARFFAFFKCQDTDVHFPRLTYLSRSEEMELYCLEEKNDEKEAENGLSILHPQASKFLSMSARYFSLTQLLQDELKRSIWQAPAPNWAVQKIKRQLVEEGGKYFFSFRISEINAVLFPDGILAVYFEAEPAFEISDEAAPIAAKMMLNSFYRILPRKNKQSPHGLLIKRFFSDARQRSAVENRLGRNDGNGLAKALCGETISFSELIYSLIPTEAIALTGNRLIVNSFLKTIWDGNGEPFSEGEFLDMLRLSRAESDHYFPDKSEYQRGAETIVNTFENVAFALSGEGMCCWVKPKTNQDFLMKQFKERYDHIYLKLFILALYQRYALVDIAAELDRAAPSKEYYSAAEAREEDELKKLSDSGDALRKIRTRIANFYLRAYFQQPAVLTNHQRYYKTLHTVLGISALLTEVQQATNELEFIIEDMHHKKAEVIRKIEINRQHEQNLNVLQEIRSVIRQQERSSHNELMLTLVVEFVGIPYYLYNVLNHVLHLNHEFSVVTTGVVTLGTIAVTIYRFISRDEEK